MSLCPCKHRQADFFAFGTIGWDSVQSIVECWDDIILLIISSYPCMFYSNIADNDAIWDVCDSLGMVLVIVVGLVGKPGRWLHYGHFCGSVSGTSSNLRRFMWERQWKSNG
jgi:hypothetical protein